MKIPKTIKISSHKIKIRQVKKIREATMQGCLGYADLTRNEICLRTHDTTSSLLPESTRAECFLHEILHHISNLYGIPIPEGKVNQLAATLLQVLRMNKLDFLGKE